MAKQIFAISVLIFFTFTTAAAQRNIAHLKNLVPDKGYWVIESNIHTPKKNIFYFYTDTDSLAYTEIIEGHKINLKRRATLKKLKNLLNNSLLALDKLNKPKNDGSL